MYADRHHHRHAWPGVTEMTDTMRLAAQNGEKIYTCNLAGGRLGLPALLGLLALVPQRVQPAQLLLPAALLGTCTQIATLHLAELSHQGRPAMPPLVFAGSASADSASEAPWR